ncbi:hypothetical protein BH24ACI2_BH24ACI2_06280 [soil metagenome]
MHCPQCNQYQVSGEFRFCKSSHFETAYREQIDWEI